MTTYNTGNPIGSTDARDRLDNSENLDIALNTHNATWVDRLGVTRDSFEGALSGLSFYRVGTFAAGYTLTNMRQTLEYGGHEYSWAGTFPKVVAAGATPETTGGIGAGAWVDRTDVTLRNELSSTDGAGLIGSISYAQLRSYSGSQTAVNVWGIYDVFDGAAGIFKVKTSDTTSADNGGTILVDALGRRWYRFFSGPVNVRWFGADNTGVVDSTPAFQSAFDAAEAFSEIVSGGSSSGASVYVPFGVYYIAETVETYARIGLFGDDVNTVITGTSVGGSSPSLCGFRFKAPTTVGIAPHIHNLTFFGFQNSPCIDMQTSGAIISDCFISNSGFGIRLSKNTKNAPASDTLIRSVIFDQNFTDIEFQSVSNVIVSDCISFIAVNAFYFNADGAGNSDVQVNNCQFNYSRSASVLCNNPNGNKNIQFTNCSFILNEQFPGFIGFVYIGSSAGSVEFFFKSCNFRNWKEYAVRLLSNNIYSFDSCVFDSNKTRSEYVQSTSSNGIQLVDCKNKPVFKNCEFRNIKQFGLEIATSIVSIIGCFYYNTPNKYTNDLVSTVYISNLSDDTGSVTSKSLKLNSAGSVNLVGLSTEPSSYAVGDIYYNTITNKLRLRTDSAWVDLN